MENKPIHELPQPEDYVKAIKDYYGTEVVVTDDIYNSKYKGWAIYISEESMDGTLLHYTTQDASKCTWLGNMTSDVQDLWDELESDIKGGYKVAIYTWFADELGNFDAEHICRDVWDYACDESRREAEKNAELNLSNIEVNED
jgi:hypothetical protein